jgi:hypothetical protein
VSDEKPFYASDREPAPARQPRPGELLFEFLVGHDRWMCELRDHGPYGIEAQFWKNEEFLMSRRFDPRLDPTRPPRELAVAWANEERKTLEQPAENSQK